MCGAVEHLDDAVGYTFAKSHDTKIDMAGSGVNRILRQKTASAVVLQQGRRTGLRYVKISKDTTKPEDVVGAFAGGDKFGFGGGGGDAALLLCFPAHCSAVEHDDIASIGAASIGAGGPVGVGVGLEHVKRER